MITIDVAIVGRAITIQEAIQKRSYEPINKTITKYQTKRIIATISNNVKLEDNNYMEGDREIIKIS